MFDSTYRKKLGEDLAIWRDRGWVTSDGASAILASLDTRSAPGFGFAAVIAVLGTLLIGFGIFAFIGANWDYMPRIFRLGLLIVCLAVAYGAGAFLQKRDLPRFADAAVLLGGFVFAAAIALIGQTYHLAGDFADAILLWLVGAMVAAFATRSVSGTVMALAGAVYWIWTMTVDNNVAPHWGGLVAVVALGIWAAWLDSRLARNAAIFALGFWIVATTMRLAMFYDWPAAGYFGMLACIGLAFWTGGLVLTTLTSRPHLVKLGHDLLTPSLGGFLVATGVLQVLLFESGSWTNTLWAGIAVVALIAAVLLAGLAQQRGVLRFADVAAVAALGAVVLALGFWTTPDEFFGRLVAGSVVILGALWWISLGHAGHPIGKKLGFLIFGAEVLYLYSVTLGTMIDTALAFLVGGVLFIGLAVLLFRLDKRLAARTNEAAI
jgi:uncharacterized membrane protein